MLSAIVRFIFGVPTTVDQVLAPLVAAQKDLQGVIDLRGDEREYKVNQIAELEYDIETATSEIDRANTIKEKLAGLLS